MIFQDPYASLNPRMKVKELVGEPLEIHTKLSKAEREKLVLEMLEVVGLNAEHADRYAHEFIFFFRNVGSAIGTEAISACVYGCFGSLNMVSLRPISTMDPKYITPI